MSFVKRFGLEGKSVLITGGSRGIGRQIALSMAESGANIAFTYARSDDAAGKVKDEIIKNGGKALAIKADAIDLKRAGEVIDEVVKEFGTIDVLVNNAGITRDTLIMRMSEEQWDEVITTNLKSVFNYSKSVIRPMMRQRSGSIINISSVIGLMGNPGQTNYAASKAGIVGFTKSLAKEIGSRNIRVNVVAPGYIVTELTHDLPEQQKEAMEKATPLGRAGTAEDVADTVIFLASEASSYITGMVLQVDGGLAI